MKPEERYKHYYNEGYNEGSVKGYEQAIEKACEWLERNYHATPMGGYYYLSEDCIEQFKQAMEGGEE